MPYIWVLPSSKHASLSRWLHGTAVVSATGRAGDRGSGPLRYAHNDLVKSRDAGTVTPGRGTTVRGTSPVMLFAGMPLYVRRYPFVVFFHTQ